MIRINLLPFRAARRKENIRQQVSIFLLSLVLLIFVLIFIHINLSGTVKELTADIEETKTELAKFNKINAEIRMIKNQLAILNNKIGVIEALQSNREGPVRLLDAMTEIIVPKRMRFTSLEERTVNETPDEATTVVAINGLASDNKTVADFMTRLEESQLFSSVNLMSITKEKEGVGLNLKTFKINCNKTPLNKAADETK